MEGASYATVPDRSAAVPRRRLARTFAGARWREYASLLEHALASGYRVRSLEEWLTDDRGDDRPTLILRHDVDQHPRAVRPMLAAERALGLTSTWYFRWRTADRRVISEVQDAGGAIGLHYETLTRAVRRDGGAPTPARIEVCRDELRREIATFKQLFGPIRSVCPHGDSRVPGVTNQVLLRGVDARDFGVEFDGNEAVRGRGLAYWLTDRSAANGRWKDGVDPLALIDDGRSPILCLTHPNNLASGRGLWADRVAARVLPLPPDGGARVLTRTAGDDPPAHRATVDVPSASAFEPVAHALGREVRRYYDARGKPLTTRAGLNTLLTNSAFAERRASTLLALLYRHSPLASVADLRVLDVGCGFGALAAVFAHEGAHVTAVDAKSERFAVGRAVADQFGLPITFGRGRMERTQFGDREYDLVVVNNALCYVLDPAARAAALERFARALRPGGWLVMRNPNRLFPVDQFTGLPLVSLLPPRAGALAGRVLGRQRSEVRLLFPWTARRELAAAGFDSIVLGSPRPGRLDRLLAPFARYQHAIARNPEKAPDA
jgi:2-polyprenyl-3-methyl-5-hydroxy-6-metoxy-1,4-benzoquinol methylase